MRWIQDNLIHGEGDWYGQKFKLRRDQKLFLYRWYEHCGNRKCGQWRYDEALRGAATGDGKTAFVAAIVCLEFAGPSSIAPPSPNIPIAAASFDQANLLFSVVATMLGGRDNIATESPLCGMFEVYDTVITRRDGKPGKIHRVAAVAGTNEGGLPSLFVCDELHEWGEVGSNRARVATVIGKSTKKRRMPRGAGRILNLSTAGFDVDHSLLGAMYKLGKKAAKKPSLAPRFLFDWQEAPAGLDYKLAKDREIAVRAASQAADLQWSVADRVAEWGKPKYPAHEWIRYFANRWVPVTEDSWLKDHPGAWASCEGRWSSSDSNPWVLTVDMALKHDSVAVARVELLPDGRIAVTTTIWTAEKSKDGRINHAVVWDHVKKHARGSGFRGVVYDPRFFEVPARLLEDEGIPVIQFDQTAQRMAPACGLTFDLILAATIVHNGDEDLAAHVLSATKRLQERGFTLSKGRSKRHIDACIAMCMGVWVLHEVPEPEAPPAAAANNAPAGNDTSDLFRPTQRLSL
ncbi:MULTISPECIES: hypothetical protein [unclassified Crossiella]|uniref:hypothetical protein n=1 Tax=unclassified Crossiella TaxID=2620835 RepID=UPI001FFEAF51|nr:MULTISPECIES: hypothetical protein [unclassified Crossiella]MCK2242155.1 hypothetical protein [Crossiella sp. S99.2]MCK2256058.1 hypothetical protein [Crossiella sp. S99.1]